MNMMKKIVPEKPFEYGICRISEYYYFTSVMYPKEECGVVLRIGNGKDNAQEIKVPYEKTASFGNVFSMGIEIGTDDFSYCYYCDDSIIREPYANAYDGEYAKHVEDSFDWEQIKSPELSLEESIIYTGHVKGLTADSSVKVKHKGTFLGIVDRIPYYQKLGVTTLELLPVYEREELKENYRLAEEGKRDNYWGFTRGYYFAPKKEFGYKNSKLELKELVKALHKNSMELILMMYFPEGLHANEILDVLHYYVDEFHVDGFRLLGVNIYLDAIISDPRLTHTKILYYGFPEKIAQKDMVKNLAICNDDGMNVFRHFLKSDDNMITAFMHHQKSNYADRGVINYITDYNSLTLKDLVCFNYKHNEANGENNADGVNDNISWNCGVEGDSRKKAIVELRKKQIKNALCMVILAMGTPKLLAGDECGNSQNGNNNPYCQDNELGWTTYSGNAFSKDIFEFTQKLITIRKACNIYKLPTAPRVMDYLSVGFPDLSYHGKEAFVPNMYAASRAIGLMYCLSYGEPAQEGMLYIVYNMHWENSTFALPLLEKGLEWSCELYTSKEAPVILDNKDIELESRSVCIFKTVQNKKFVKGSLLPTKGRTAF